MTAQQAPPEKITLEFIHKGSPGPTIETQSKVFVVEIHFDGQKHLVRLPIELSPLIPSFSVLKVI